jgi:hypothetical protein
MEMVVSAYAVQSLCQILLVVPIWIFFIRFGFVLGRTRFRPGVQRFNGPACQIQCTYSHRSSPRAARVPVYVLPCWPAARLHATARREMSL